MRCEGNDGVDRREIMCNDWRWVVVAHDVVTVAFILLLVPVLIRYSV